MALSKKPLGLFLLAACTGTSTNHEAIPSPADASTDGSQDAADIHLGLIGHWNFDEPTGSIVKDVSGFANTGTVVQGTAPDAPSANVQWATSHWGLGLDLDGQNTWVRVNPSQSINSTGRTGKFTVAAWIKPRTSGTAGKLQWVISRNEEATAFRHFALGLDQGRLRFDLHFKSVTTETTVPVDQWTHVAGTSDGLVSLLYIDGELKKTGDVYFPIAADETNMVIGGAQDIETMTGFFIGVIDDVQLYNVTLSAAQVKQLAQRL